MECTYCHGTNHTRNRCYHLIGFPPGKTAVNSGKVVAQMSISSQGGNNNEIKDTYVDHNAQTSYQIVNTALNNAQYQQLLQLLN